MKFREIGACEIAEEPRHKTGRLKRYPLHCMSKLCGTFQPEPSFMQQGRPPERAARSGLPQTRPTTVLCSRLIIAEGDNIARQQSRL